MLAQVAGVGATQLLAEPALKAALAEVYGPPGGQPLKPAAAGRLLGISPADRHMVPARAMPIYHLSKRLEQVGCWVFLLVGHLASARAVRNHKLSKLFAVSGCQHLVPSRLLQSRLLQTLLLYGCSRWAAGCNCDQALISPEHSQAKPAKLAAAGGLLANPVSVWHLKSVADFQAIKPAAADWSSA